MYKNLYFFVFIVISVFSCNTIPNPKMMCYELIEEMGKQMLNNKPYNGSCYTVYEENDQQVDEIRSYKKGIMHGVWAKYYINGQLQYSGVARRGNIHGLYKFYRENGTLAEEGKFKDGYRDGTWKYYNLAEEVEKTEFYKDQVFIGEDYKN